MSTRRGESVGSGGSNGVSRGPKGASGANGSTALIDTNPNSRTTFTWDAANRLQSALQPNGQALTFTYWHYNLRHSRQQPGNARQVVLWNREDVLAYDQTARPHRFVDGRAGSADSGVV